MKTKVAGLFLLGLGAVAVSYAETSQLKSLPELMAALNAGASVRLVVHYAKCRLVDEGKEVPAPDAVGGMGLGTFEYFARQAVRNEKAYLSASQAVLIGHPRYGFIIDYAKFSINEDDEVKITVQYLAPQTYEVKMEETFFTRVNDGRNDGGLFLFLER